MIEHRSRMRESITVDELTFTLRRSRRRRTIGITVQQDGALLVAAPTGCSLRHIEAAVRSKLPWVRRKLAEAAARPSPPQRLWMDGELLWYLGTPYPLHISPDGATAVRLCGDHFRMHPAAAAAGRRHMIDWYTQRGSELLPARVGHYGAQLGVMPVSVAVADLGRRWGTCRSDGRLRFHWQIVAFPPAIVDYVVVHELAHLLELNHSRGFWARVEQVLPDYRRSKVWLRDLAGACSL